MTQAKLPAVHFVGLGGIGMSGIARLYRGLGHPVSGSDLRPGPILDDLARLGVRVHVGHDASHVDGADWLVYSSSIPERHPERERAVRLGLRILHRSEALAELCRGKRTIAVTGTHGKTTTTSLAGLALRKAGRDPSIVVGGLVEEFGGNALSGTGPEFVLEADESDSSFLRFSPYLAVVTNIEAEHLDHFGSIERVVDAYRAFVGRVDRSGAWIGCADDPRVLALADEDPGRAILYGLDSERARWRATEIEPCPQGSRGVAFTAWDGTKRLGRVRLGLVGRHNVSNALAVLALTERLGIPFETAAESLAVTAGARRRFDVRHEDGQFLVVDDYAHHPTEIRSTLEAARSIGRRRIVAVFQPHRYTRTESLMGDFAGSFAQADKLVVTDIYAASESPLPGVTGRALCERIALGGHPDVTFVERPRVSEYLRAQILPGDLVIALGAGDIHETAEELSRHLSAVRPSGGPFAGLRGRVLQNEPLSRHTSLRIGGPADYWIEPEDEADLAQAIRACRRAGIRLWLLGAGSNVLAPDEGLRGAVVHLGAPAFKSLSSRDGLILAGAGVPNSLFIQHALEHGLGGCEFLQGIPGNIGGAVAMNAGSHGQSVDAILEHVDALEADGSPARLRREDIAFSYRHAGLGERIVCRAAFRLPARDRARSQELLDRYRDHRSTTQDLRHPSAGCMFKNPPGGLSSGRLIDEAGLKGLTVGRAQVSERHANFLINLGGATASDARELMRRVREEVERRHGVRLEAEVRCL